MGGAWNALTGQVARLSGRGQVFLAGQRDGCVYPHPRVELVLLLLLFQTSELLIKACLTLLSLSDPGFDPMNLRVCACLLPQDRQTSMRVSAQCPSSDTVVTSRGTS